MVTGPAFDSISTINRGGNQSSLVRWPAGLGSLLLTCLLAFVGPHNSTAQWIENEDLVGPFVDHEPFELLFLNAGSDNAILKIRPLSEPLRSPFPDKGILIFQFATETDEQLQVPYSCIKVHKTFNDILIEEANQWLAEKQYAPAFRNLLYVYDHGGKQNDASVKSLRSCMFIDATDNFRAGRFELALSIFEDIYARTPDFQVPGIDKKLIEIILLCYDGILQKDFDAHEFATVQLKMAAISKKYQVEAQPLTSKWEGVFIDQADQLMAQARQFVVAGQGRQAQKASRQAEQLTPDRGEVKQLQAEILKAFPLIVIGTSQPPADADGQRLDHWGSRRVGRLTKRTIVELAGLGDEGGKYVFLNGTLIQTDELGLKYRFELTASPTSLTTPPTDAYMISSRLLSAANPDSSFHNDGWEKILQDVEIRDSNQVLITLRVPFVRPEALLSLPYADPVQVSLTPPSIGSENIDSDELGYAAGQNGSYLLSDIDNNFATLELNPQYQSLPNRQHPVLIEQLFPAASTAVDELIKGNIDVVDRVPVADLARLKAANGIVVRPYLIPTVHMLIPKIRGQLKDDLYFRSALSHAIDRNVLLNKTICDGQEVSGCEVLSGPFPIGTEENDQISYGYDLKIRPAMFNSQLAMVLVELALRPTLKRPEKIVRPALVLAHPSSTTAKQAATAIAQMWSAIGVETTTLELKPGASVPSDDQWDMLYLEVTMEEPLTDIARIVGRNGIATDVSAPVEQTMRDISYANSWRSACTLLRRLHRQLSVDLSVIPLWQVKEHFAFRNTVTGVGRELIHLYQNVDRWQIDIYGTDEEE